jgi:zinc protease
MNTLIQRFVTVVVVLAWAHTSAAQTADEVIEKSIAAMGGRAAMEKIKSRLMTGTLTLETPAGNIVGSVESLNAVPNKARTLIKADLSAFGAGQLVVDQRFDGATGYVLDSLQGNRDITGSQLEGMKANSFPHPFLNYKAMGVTVTMAAKEKAAGREAFLLTFQPTSGPPVKQYVDAETFMPLRTIIQANAPQVGDFEQNIDPSDFREVDGVKVPFKMQLSSSMQSVSMAFTKVEHNVTVDEKLFVKPQ